MPYQIIKVAPNDDHVTIQLLWNPANDFGHGNVQIEARKFDNSVEPTHSGILDRDDINRFIRALRRARDMTYGKDS